MPLGDMGFMSGVDPGNVNVGAAYDAATNSQLGGGLGLTDPVNPADIWGGSGGGSMWGAVRGAVPGLLSFNPALALAGGVAGYYGPQVYDWAKSQLGFGPPPGSTPVGPQYAAKSDIWGAGSPVAAGGYGGAPMGSGPVVGAAPMTAAGGFLPGGVPGNAQASFGGFGNIDPRSMMYAQALMQPQMGPRTEGRGG